MEVAPEKKMKGLLYRTGQCLGREDQGWEHEVVPGGTALVRREQMEGRQKDGEEAVHGVG